MTILLAIVLILLCIGLPLALWYCLASANRPRWFVCSWCKIHFSDDGQTSVEMPADWDGVQTSHGICPKCHKFELEKLDQLSPPAAFLPSPSTGAPPWRGQAGK